ncbi:hypothetical protein OKW21_006245 [Catalinimonas alkaloidigena]|uniref:hypothetical protein n=1 Tax=Catalinimonas alkaloidigena TaxID=1075417 RepID=UPI002406C84B|nr:hypothetical protein [Catalinimonas alkaloidigena]MDF9800982.1 hypothetical protein [Catalinimonas alkaloidigena]
MKKLLTKNLWQVLFLSLLILNSGCDCFPPWKDCNDDPPSNGTDYSLKNSYEGAIDLIDDFKGQLKRNASNNSILLRSSNSARPGQVWIWNTCDNSIQNNAENLTSRFPGDDYLTGIDTDPLTSNTISFDWERRWSTRTGFGIDVNYNLLEALLEAAYEKTNVYAFNFRLQLINVEREYLRNTAPLIDKYEEMLLSEGLESDGNILVTGVIKGQLKVEYKALNKKGEKVDINLSASLNEILSAKAFKPNFNYFNENATSSDFSVIEESGENLTAFIIEYWDIPEEIQNTSDISATISEFCDDDDVFALTKNVTGFCSVSGKEIIDLKLETGANNNGWYPYLTNKTDHTITSLQYTLTVRNRFGQIIGQENRLVTQNINPGATIPGSRKFDNFSLQIQGYPANSVLPLYDVEIEFDITQVRHQLNDLCI